MKIKKSELAKLRKEVNKEFKPLNTTKEIITWYKDLIKKSKIKIKTIPLSECKNWSFNWFFVVYSFWVFLITYIFKK